LGKKNIILFLFIFGRARTRRAKKIDCEGLGVHVCWFFISLLFFT